jgi:hypothetical protein
MNKVLRPITARSDYVWTPRHARHLLNRAGFGVPVARLIDLAGMTPKAAVESLVRFENQTNPLPEPDWIPRISGPGAMEQAMRGMEDADRRRMRNELQSQSRQYMSRMQVWWIDRMCHTNRPLEEKLALFWHGHFATSAEKVRDPRANYELNQIFRRHGAGDFRKLLGEVAKSPAMMRYLDQDRSSRQKPNENWARECLELFSLGIGNYTEDDIKEAARAFTGWTVDRQGRFQFVARRHDPGRKTFLGRSGNFDGDQILDIIVEQEACAEFICGKLWSYFVGQEAPAEIRRELSRTFRSHGGAIRPVLEQIFLSEEFYQPQVMNAQIKSPAQLVVNLLVQLDSELEERPPIAQLAMRAMGQSLFSPPNVRGWVGGKDWINTNTLLIRCNFANYLVSGIVPPISGQRLRGLDGGLRDRVREGRMEGMGQMMMGEEPEERGMMAPAGQDAMPTDVAARTLYEAMMRQRESRQGRVSSSALETDIQMAAAPFRAHEHFSRYEGMTPRRVVAEMANYFLGLPLDAQQEHRVLAALTAGGIPADEPLAVATMPGANLRAAVQLLLSAVEYQVC